jgi:tetratricopeptide (TPR) repeat protein
MPAEDFPAENDTFARRPRRRAQVDFELDFFARILERDPCYAAVLKVHADNLAGRGQWVRALQLDRRLVRLQPERPIPWYNLACSYAKLGMTDQAFHALYRAADLGYALIDHMASDPDLKSLRRDPRFARLMRRVLSAD